MSTLPPALPPPPPPGSSVPAPPATGDPTLAPRTPRAGELTGTWRITVLVVWVGIVLVYASVWRTSRTMGLATWWLGPSAEPQVLVVQLLPFVAPLAMVVAASRPTRHLPWFGLAASAVGVAIALGDLGTFDRLAFLQLVAAAAGVFVSLGSFAGVLRLRAEN